MGHFTRMLMVRIIYTTHASDAGQIEVSITFVVGNDDCNEFECLFYMSYTQSIFIG